MKKRLLGLVIITIIAVLALVGCDLIIDVAPKQYTVTFDVDGGSPVAPIKVNDDGFVTKPEDPTKEGFDFAGWYKDAARTEAWVFNYHKITENTTLYAKWVDHVHVGGTATCEDSAVCSVCGESYGTPLGHTPVTDAAVAPTCGKDGLTEGSHCDVCGKVLVAQETVPATGNHAWGEWVTDREATEDADGAKHRDCSVCGAKEEGIIPSLVHQHSYKSEVTTAPGCETKGTMTFSCGCGDSYTEEIPATGHAWDAGEITTAPTCVAPGVKTFTCQNDASHTKTEEIAIDPNAHTLVDVEGKAATCEEDGYTAYKKCSNQGCEHTVGKQTLPALGHKWNEGEVTVPATYGHKGTKTFTCQNDASHTKTEDIAQLKLADNATAAEIVNAAYSLEKGEALIGEFTLTGVITKVDFAYNSYNKNISITIKVTGADESKTIYCYKLVGDDADKIVAGDTVTVTGPIKNYNGTVEFDQGCELVSYTEHEHQWSEATCKVLATCSICKKTTGEFADHSYGTDGICTVCGHDKNSKEAWVLVTDVAQLKDGAEIVIVATNANYAIGTNQKSNNRAGASVAKSNNTVTINDGVQVITVGIDDNGNYTFYVEGTTKGYLYAAGGTGSNYLKTTSNVSNTATWTITIADGIATIKCVDSATTRNQIRYNPNTGNGDPLFSCYASGQQDVSIYVKTTTEVHTCTPADAVKENEVAPTCTAAGSYDEVVYCSECGKEISRTTVTVNALGHTPVVDAKVDATCESTGLTEGSHCSVCGEVIVAQTEIAALGHKWDDGVVTTNPTCEDKGVKTFTCQHDSKHTKTEDVAALGHDWDEGVVTTNPTCESTGVKTFTCQHDSKHTKTEDVAALGHTDKDDNNVCDVCTKPVCGKDDHKYVGVETTAPTCTTVGTMTYTCSACGDSYTEEIAINANAHKWNDGVVTTEPTCSAEGVKTFTCQHNSEHKKTENIAIDASAHDWNDGVVTTAPTCSAEGVKTFTCQHNNAHTYTEKVAIDEDAHDWNDGEETKAATYGHTGVKTFTCQHDATHTKTEPIAKLVLGGDATAEAIVNAAYTLLEDETLEGEFTLTGVIVNVDEAYTTKYGNVTVTIKVNGADETKLIKCFRMKGTGADVIGKGDTITVTGEITNYLGNTIEFIQGCTLDSYTIHTCDWDKEATCDAPATCNICGKQNTVAHTPSENELTCSTPIICTVCKSKLEKIEHVDENKNGKCDVCKADVPISAGDRKIAFEFGANGEAKHVDGDDLGKSKSYENGEYTLALTEMSKVFGPAYDLKGNSCIKLGTSKVTGGFTFTVPDDVTSVIIYVAGYKGATSTNIKINGTQHTVKTASDNGKYTAIEIDTTTTKTITLVTVTYRAMIDSIVFVVPGEIKSHVHNQTTREENRVESTCAVAGHYDLVTYCSDEDCGEEISRTRVELELADHSYNTAVTSPTCTEDGYTTYTCSVCGHSYEDDYVDALGHKEVAHDAKAATCTEAGHKAYVTCERCNYTTYEEVAKLGHNLVDVAEKKATCTEAGYSAHKDCSRCDYIEGKEDYAVLGHSWKDATCEAPKTCGTCGATEGEANGHTVVVDEAVAPTCTATGLTEGSHCSVCGEVLKAQTVVDALGHTEVIDKAVAPTCESTGLTEGSHCSVCKKVLVEQTVVEKLGHTPGEAVKEDVVESTCTSEGNYELAVYCSVCKKALSRDYITTPVAEHAKVQHEAKAATCTEIGWNAYETCKNCSYTTYVELPALDHIDEDNNNVCDREDCKAALCQDGDHVEGEGEVTTPATCVATGTRTFKCTACGEILRTEEIDINPNAHNMVKMPSKAATCTENGHSVYEACTLCGFEDGKNPLPALGHMYTIDVAAKDATCTEAGHTAAERCMRCDHTRGNETIPALGHDMTVAVNGQDATCTVDGYTAHTKCSRCDYTEGKVVIPATDHAWDNACDTTCNNCGETRVIEHDIVTDAAVAATCTETGLTEGKHCSVCNEVLVAQTVVDALGHTAVVDAAVAATCTTPGKTEGSHCSVCGEVLVAQTVVPAPGHDPGEPIQENIVPATCAKAGSYDKVYYCTVCKVETRRVTGLVILATGEHKDTDFDYDCDVCGTLVEPEADSIITIEQAIKIGKLLENDQETTNKYYVSGIITEITDTEYGNSNIEANGHTIYVYGIYDENGTVYPELESKPYAGDSVKLYGTIKSYNSIIEIFQPVLVEFTHEHSYSEATCTVPATCVCGDTDGEALGHAWNDATCTAPKTCGTCGATEGTALEHSYTNGYCTNGCNGVDPDYYFPVTITEALAAEDGWKVQVSGTVCAVNTSWNGSNISVTIVDADENQLYVYSMTTEVALGDIITVKGAMGTYNGNRQIAKGATAEITGHDSSYDYVEMSIEDAIAAEDNTNVIVTGTVVTIDTPYSDQYGNISVYIASENGTKLYLYRLSGNVEVGQIIKVKGTMGTHNEARQVTGGTFEEVGTHECSNWTAATCQTPKTCVVCGATTGEVADHDYVDGKCTVCGIEDGHEHTDADEDLACDTCGLAVIPAAETKISIKLAIALGASKDHDTYTDGKYYVTGTITEIYNTKYGNMYIADENGNTLTIYGSYNADGTVGYSSMNYKHAVGQTVTVYGIVGQYNSKAQIKNGWVTIVHEHEYGKATCEVLATCSICGATTGELADHDYVDGKCTVCGEVDPDYEGEVVIPTTVTVSIADYAAANGWANSTKYTSLTMDSNVTVTVSGGSNTGKYYTSGYDWRIYQNEEPNISVTTANGATIVSVKITYTISNSGVLTLNGNNITSGTVVAVNAASVQFGVGNTSSDVANGQVRITAIEVVYSGGKAPCAHTTNETLWGEGEITKVATCTTAGEKTYTCTVEGCGATKTEEIPATGHADANKDHACDNGCDVYQGSHVDNNGDTVCDYGCSEKIEAGTVTPVEEVTISKTAAEIMGLAGLSTSNGTSVNNKEIALDDNISITCSQGSASTAPSYYSPAIRLYQNGATLTVKGKGMKTIIITVDSSAGDGPIDVSGGTASALTSMKYTITVDENAETVVITTTGTDKNSRVYVSNIEVTYQQ